MSLLITINGEKTCPGRERCAWIWRKQRRMSTPSVILWLLEETPPVCFHSQIYFILSITKLRQDIFWGDKRLIPTRAPPANIPGRYQAKIRLRESTNIHATCCNAGVVVSGAIRRTRCSAASSSLRPWGSFPSCAARSSASQFICTKAS